MVDGLCGSMIQLYLVLSHSWIALYKLRVSAQFQLEAIWKLLQVNSLGNNSREQSHYWSANRFSVIGV